MSEARTCNNCGKDGLATDTICWHCGAELPKVQLKTAVSPDPDADILAQERSKTAVFIYAALFTITAITLMATLYTLGQRPLFILNSQTERPAGWTAITNQPQTFTLNLPPNWEWLDKADEAEAAAVDARFEADEGMQTAVLPFLSLLPDSKLLFIAQDDVENNAPFLLILQADALAALTPPALIATAEAAVELNGRLRESNIIENSITGDQIDFRLDFAEDGLQCQHRVVKTAVGGYLLVACAPDATYGRYTANLFNTLSSFQPLEK